MRQNNRRVYLRTDGGLGSFCSPLSSFFLPFSIFPGRLACRDCLKRLLCSQLGIGRLDGGRRMRLGYLLPLFLSLQIPLLSCDPLLVATNTLRYPAFTLLSPGSATCSLPSCFRPERGNGCLLLLAMGCCVISCWCP